MAKSKALKIREKRLREGNRDVSKSRGTWGDLKPISRMTKTKQATLEKYEKKHKRNQSQAGYENGSFLYFATYTFKFLLFMKVYLKNSIQIESHDDWHTYNNNE